MVNSYIFSSNMKKFLVKVILFLLLIIISATLLDLFLSSRLLRNENRMFSTWSQIYNDSTNYDLIINGSSRAWTQYNPIMLDSMLNVNSYNLGMDGSGITRQIVKYKKYCEYHKTPKHLIQNIDFITIDTTFGYEREQFFPYFIYDRSLMQEMDVYEKFSFAEKFIPSYRYIGYRDVLTEALFNYSSQARFEFLFKGYLGNNSTWNGTELAKLDSVVFSCNAMALHLFIDFLEQTTKQGTKVLFVYAPVYHGVRTKMTNEHQMYEMYDTIAARFNIPILDYNDIPLCYDTTYFYNGTHLNRIGAESFTIQLAHDIDSIGFLK